MKIAISAGGSGGHIYPALSLARALEKRGHEITFIGSNDRMEKDVIPQNGFKYLGLDVYTTRGGILQKIKSAFSLLRAYFQCLKILKGFDIAIGFGNYISVPVMEAAIRLGLKTIIHEQNSFVGRANRMLDEKVDLIIGCYEENKQQFRNRNLRILGNPQSSNAYMLPKDPEVLRKLGLDPDKKTVLMFMGSLGSASVNKVLLDYFKLLDGSYQVIYASGKSIYDEVRKQVEDRPYLKIFERVDGAAVMNNATLLVSRAGATTLCEICAIGIPSILIPSPFVPNNHQYYNGKALTDKDAAIMIEEKDLNAAMLKETIDNVINDEAKLRRMADNALKLGNPHVLDDIINAIEEL